MYNFQNGYFDDMSQRRMLLPFLPEEPPLVSCDSLVSASTLS